MNAFTAWLTRVYLRDLVMLVYGCLVLTIVLGLLAIFARIPLEHWQALLAVPAFLAGAFLCLRSRVGPILFNLLYRSMIVSAVISALLIPLIYLLPLT